MYWNKDDDRRWDEGIVYCCCPEGYHISITSELPKNCPYFLEQFLYHESNFPDKEIIINESKNLGINRN